MLLSCPCRYDLSRLILPLYISLSTISIVRSYRAYFSDLQMITLNQIFVMISDGFNGI